MKNQLSHAHQLTLRAVHQHPLAHNLEWRKVVSLVEAMGQVVEEHDGHFLFTVDGQSHTFRRPHEKDISDMTELMNLRHLLQRAEDEAPEEEAPQEEAPAPRRLLVVVSHKETSVYETQWQDALLYKLTPYDPHGFLQHLHHKEGGDANGSRAPEDPTFYENIALTLKGADEILMLGDGKGHSSAMEHLMEFLSNHHKNLADIVVGRVRLDIESTTPAEMLAAARDFYASGAGAASSSAEQVEV